MYRRTTVWQHQQVAVLISTMLCFVLWKEIAVWPCTSGILFTAECEASSNPRWSKAKHSKKKRGGCPGTIQATGLFCVSCRSSAVSSWRSSERLSQRSSQQRWRQPGPNSWLTCVAVSQLSIRKRAGLSCHPKLSEGLRFTGSGADSTGR